MSRNFRSSYIVAYWAKADGRIKEYYDMGLTPQPGVIKYFVKHCLMVIVTRATLTGLHIVIGFFQLQRI